MSLSEADLLRDCGGQLLLTLMLTSWYSRHTFNPRKTARVCRLCWIVATGNDLDRPVWGRLVYCKSLWNILNNYAVFVLFTLQEELVLPLQSKRSPINGLCCLTFGLVIFMSGLVLASIYVYRYYFISQVSFRFWLIVTRWWCWW